MLLLLLTFHCFSVIDWFHRGVKELEEVVVLLAHSTQPVTELKLCISTLEHVLYY